MGAGKTTVGKQLAKDLGLPFYDLDWYIESRMRKKISQIFEERGDGTPCFFDNMDYMNENSDVIYLKATPEVLYAHLQMGRSVRPLIVNKTKDELLAFIKEQLAYREQFYMKAKHILDVTLMESPEKISISVEKAKELIGQK